ncbi:MAG TPA: hypothetical protein VLV89_10495 [Candidatus Acidoferrum sp.]|nr:hypothetical protein [Candidatus Acidoferrum sp.]
MRSTTIICLTLAGTLLATPAIPFPSRTESGGQSANGEQTVFAIEGTTEKKHKTWIDHPPIEHPVPIPDPIMKVLRADKLVTGCLATENVTEAPAAWFMAAEIHLHKNDQADYIVLPSNECLYGPFSDPFWIFGQAGNGYDLLFRSDLLGIAILNSRTNEYRDIRTTFVLGNQRNSVKFKFDGHKYQPG